MPDLNDKDRALIEKMRRDPPGTVRTADERVAYERWWDEQVKRQAETGRAGVTDRV